MKLDKNGACVFFKQTRDTGNDGFNSSELHARCIIYHFPNERVSRQKKIPDVDVEK